MGRAYEYKAKAAALGLSLWQLIQHGVESYGEHVAPVKPTPTQPTLTTEQRKILDAVESLPESSRKALLKFLQTLVDEMHD